MRRTIGELDGTPVEAVALAAPGGLRAEIVTCGARLSALWVPGRDGALADIVPGRPDLAGWADDPAFMGATCGRYANRIAWGRFVLDGQPVQLDCNEGPNTLHGGGRGFDRKPWQVAEATPDAVVLTAQSPAGEMGFPGRLTLRCTYRLEPGRLWIDMRAETDAPTVVNLVNHAYFNLAGGGDVRGHHLQILAGHMLPVDAARIPTGEIRAVDGTAFDFRQPRQIGAQMPDETGFDHCYCLSAPVELVAGHVLRPAARLWDAASGRCLRLWTTEPGLQLYTGYHLGGLGKAGALHPFAGLALETQKFPDSPNRPQFPPARLDPGQRYRHLMLCDFTPLAG